MREVLELAPDVDFGHVTLDYDVSPEALEEGTIARVTFDPLMWLDKATGDKRRFRSNGFTIEELPSFISFKDTLGGTGHDGARIAGSLRHVETGPDGKVTGWGYLIDNPAGHDCLTALRTKAIKGTSADLRDCRIDRDETEALGLRASFATSSLAGVTICPIPAFNDTVARLDDFAMVASGTLIRDLRPPRDAFENPRFNRKTGIRVVPLTSEFNQVFGHLALWDQPHMSIQGKKIYPPREDDLSKFYTGGTVLVDDGTFVPVGRLFIGKDHPDVKLGAQQALDTYAATCAAWADVRVGKDRFGIWFAGVTRPSVSEELMYEARASAVSGDWRPFNGRKRLVAALSCNFPGFPVYEDSNEVALIASGPPPEIEDADPAQIEVEVEPAEPEALATPPKAAKLPTVKRNGLLLPTRIFY